MCVCVFCALVWLCRLMRLCVVHVDYCVMLYGFLLCVMCCVCVLCLFNVCDLFVNVSNGAVWFACIYICLCLCVVGV